MRSVKANFDLLDLLLNTITAKPKISLAEPLLKGFHKPFCVNRSGRAGGVFWELPSGIIKFWDTHTCRQRGQWNFSLDNMLQCSPHLISGDLKRSFDELVFFRTSFEQVFSSKLPFRETDPSSTCLDVSFCRDIRSQTQILQKVVADKSPTLPSTTCWN